MGSELHAIVPCRGAHERSARSDARNLFHRDYSMRKVGLKTHAACGDAFLGLVRSYHACRVLRPPRSYCCVSRPHVILFLKLHIDCESTLTNVP